MKKFLIIIVRNLIITSIIYADEIDSLKNILKTVPESEQADILNQIADIYTHSSTDSALVYSEKALGSAKNSNNTKQIATAHKNLARTYSLLQNYDEALKSINESDSILSILLQTESNPENKLLHGYILELKGRIYENKSEYIKALEIYQTASNTFEEIDDKEGLALVYSDMGYIHNALGNNSKSLYYFNLVYEIYLQLDNKQGIASALNNNGIIYDTEGKGDSALYYYFESIKINKELNNIQVIAYLYHNIAIVYEFQLKYDLALEYYYKSLDLTDEINDMYGSISTLTRIGIIYREKENYPKSLELLNQSLILSDSIKSFEIKKEVLLELSNTYELVNNYKQSLYYHRQYVYLKDSIFSNSMHEQIAELETKYDTEQKEQKIILYEKDKKIQDEASKRKNILLISIVSILLLIIGVAILLFRALSIKRKSNAILTERNIRIMMQKEEIQAQAEELEIINSELEKLSIVASETDNAILITDEIGNIEWVNTAFTKIYGYQLEEFIQVKGQNIIKASSDKSIKEKLDTILTEKKSISYESFSKSKTGESIWMQTTVTPLLDEQKNITKLIIIDSNIIELKQAQQEIIQKNEEITAQSEEIILKSEEISTQNQLIKGSIRYAKNIQNAILPPQSRIDAHFENFILYRPKDIVSGDFYWFSQLKDRETEEFSNQFIAAAVDCTGHGVPGAFMSMISNMLLNEIINENKIYSPKIILTELKNKLLSRSDKTKQKTTMV